MFASVCLLHLPSLALVLISICSIVFVYRSLPLLFTLVYIYLLSLLFTLFLFAYPAYTSLSVYMLTSFLLVLFTPLTYACLLLFIFYLAILLTALFAYYANTCLFVYIQTPLLLTHLLTSDYTYLLPSLLFTHFFVCQSCLHANTSVTCAAYISYIAYIHLDYLHFCLHICLHPETSNLLLQYLFT